VRRHLDSARRAILLILIPQGLAGAVIAHPSCVDILRKHLDAENSNIDCMPAASVQSLPEITPTQHASMMINGPAVLMDYVRDFAV